MALEEEFDGPRPLRAVQLLGEPLVAFRDEQGAYGLLDRHCPHRGADLCFGRLEDGGLRCAFHGWLFDVSGACLEQPAEPPDSSYFKRIRHTAYPCIAPTINGYKRYRPFSLAPDRAVASRDNRGAMVRLVGGHGDPGTRIENRIGDPAANPYLYLTSQIVSGLLGIENQYPACTYSSTPYDTNAEMLPTTLMAAVAALRQDTIFREVMGESFVDYFLHIKDAEIERYLACVSDWEQREYFSTF